MVESLGNYIMPIVRAALLRILDLNGNKNWSNDGDTIKIDFRQTNENAEKDSSEPDDIIWAAPSLNTSEVANIDEGDRRNVDDTDLILNQSERLLSLLRSKTMNRNPIISDETIETEENAHENPADVNIAPESRIKLNIPLDNLDATDEVKISDEEIVASEENDDASNENDETEVAQIHHIEYFDSIANTSHSKSKHLLEESVIEKPENSNENLNESKFNQMAETKIKETSEEEKHSMEYLDEIKSTMNLDLLRKRDGDDPVAFNDDGDDDDGDDNDDNGDSGDKTDIGSQAGEGNLSI